MMRRYLPALAAIAMLAAPSLALANARLISVTPLDGGCVSGPTGPTVQAWDVEPGKTYQMTISNVTECANGGTDATLNVRVNSTSSGNTDLIATMIAAGTYQFSFTIPLGATCTLPIFYCTTPGNANSGLFVWRNDGVAYQAHLRAATFDAGCTNPAEILGPDCLVVPSRPSSWGRVKQIYR
jgi:hypothetical protein